MTARKIEIDDEIWRPVRVRALAEGTTAAALVNDALRAYLADPVGAIKDAGVREIKDVKLHEVVVTAAPLKTVSGDPLGQVLAVHAAEQEDPWTELSGQAASSENGTVSPESGSVPPTPMPSPPSSRISAASPAPGSTTTPTVIRTPEEAAAIAANLRGFNPVPKPSKAKPASKRR